ncbi:hypothetical protein [Bdellovibrio sp. HCB337]|uniref:hypothetical protein n=1 Tax=Bdellovibrio sp. HCB337 TaxID=3394358 RepID=UPI0039A5528F
MNDLSTWVTALASAVLAWAAYSMWRVSRNTLKLQSSVEKAKKPFCNIWYNGTPQSDLGHIQNFTVGNIGMSALTIRTLRILFGSEKIGRSTHIAAYTVDGKEKKLIGRQSKKKLVADLIITSKQLCFIEAECSSGRLHFEVMYYDNSFEFIEIDTSNLGGKYILMDRGGKLIWP